MLDNGWGWPLNDEAAMWDRKLDQLAVAFRALHHDDDAESPNGIFMWAWWSVAMAFGMRVTAAERGLLLDVWKRPSFGRTPRRHQCPGRPGHTRCGRIPLPAVSAGASRLQPAEFTWPVRLDVSRKGASRPRASRDVAVLLVRMGGRNGAGYRTLG